MSSRDDALKAVADYLGQNHWTINEDIESDDVGQMVDPLTGRSHDVDYAFTVQLQRDQADGFATHSIPTTT